MASIDYGPLSLRSPSAQQLPPPASTPPPPLLPVVDIASNSDDKQLSHLQHRHRHSLPTRSGMPHQQPHSHRHHEPSRHLPRKSVVAAAPTDVINPRILDASIRDVTERLSSEQKAEVLIHAMNLLKLANPFSHHIVENGVMSCLQAANLGTPQRVQALLLRGRARMAAGELVKARQDLYQVLETVPDHAVAKSLLSIPILNDNSSHARDIRIWNIETASHRLSPELWRQIASYLPRRDLKTLMRIPHVLSRIAFERVFTRIDIHLGIVRLHREDRLWGDADPDHPDRESVQIEKELAKRTAAIIARILRDPSFAKLVETVRISAERREHTQHMSFRADMLATALPKLISLREVIFTGSNDVWAQLAPIIGQSQPRLASLSIEPEHDSEPILPHLTNLRQFKCVRDHSSHELGSFLAQNRATLRKLCLCAYYATFPAPPAIAFSNLTHLEFVGTIPVSPYGAGVLTSILTNCVNLEALRLNLVLLTPVSEAFVKVTATPFSLPKLRRFGFTALEHLGPCASDPHLFPAISEFLRTHPDLRRLELDCKGEGNQRSLGYDNAVLGVLPSLSKLRMLGICVGKDSPPGLLTWILPRGLRALSLTGIPRRGAEAFLLPMRAGMPAGLRFIALPTAEVKEEHELAFVETVLPRSIRLLSIADKFITVHRRPTVVIGGSPSQSRATTASLASAHSSPSPRPGTAPGSGAGAGAGTGSDAGKEDGGEVESLEEWPERRVGLHAEEWLESMGCEDAIWDDFAPACFA